MIDAGGGVLHAVADTYLEGCAEARADGFGQLIDLTAVDYLTYGAPRNLPAAVEAERFEVVTQLINHSTRERIRIRTRSTPMSQSSRPCSIFGPVPRTSSARSTTCSASSLPTTLI